MNRNLGLYDWGKAAKIEKFSCTNGYLPHVCLYWLGDDLHSRK